MVEWEWGTVVKERERRNGYQEVWVRLSGPRTLTKAVVYTDLYPAAAPGDTVLLNRTAIGLGLGSGGIDFVAAVLRQGQLKRPTEDIRTSKIPIRCVEDEEAIWGRGASLRIEACDEWAAEAVKAAKTSGAEEAVICAETGVIPLNSNRAEAASDTKIDRQQHGHMMKWRYTPVQTAVKSVEEPDSEHHSLFTEERSLEGTPVLIGELHSMLPVAVCWLRTLAAAECTERMPRIVYVMTDGGALPLAFSRHASILGECGFLAGTVTYGHAVGGDLEAVNKYTALLAAKHVLRADLIIVTMGPGIAGTGTVYGFSGIEAGEIVNAAAALGGRPIVIPRVSFADERVRHRGLSHHVLTTLAKVASHRAILPLPDDLQPWEKQQIVRQAEESGCARKHDLIWVGGNSSEQVAEAIRSYPEPIRTMGRGWNEDRAFFLAVAAAAETGWRLWRYPHYRLPNGG